MGQTLTNGIYLPDEGERNSYSGLEANWRTLDALILTVNGKAAPNIANTWTAAQTFAAGIAGDLTGNVTGDLTGTASKAIADEDGTSIKTGYVHVAGNQTVSGQKTWSGENTYTNTYLTQKHTGLEEGELPASNQTRRFRFTDKNNASLGWLQHRVNTSGDSALELLVVNKFSNGQLSTQGSEVLNSVVVGLHGDGSRFLTTLGDVYPDLPTRVCNLGTSTNKWKTLNGVNPGALSLPNISSAVNLDTTNWNLTGGNNPYSPPLDGFISIRSTTATQITIVDNITGYGTSIVSAAADNLTTFLPVKAGMNINIIIKCTTLNQCKLIPCLGNV